MTEKLDLDTIEARANAATEGPWMFGTKKATYRPAIGHPDGLGGLVAHIDAIDMNETDAEFIAASRTDVPALVARVRELEATVERVREYGEKMRTANGMSWCSMHGTSVLRALEEADE